MRAREGRSLGGAPGGYSGGCTRTGSGDTCEVGFQSEDVCEA